MPELTTTVKVGKMNRVTIPPELCDTLNIDPGDVVEITVRPALEKSGNNG